MSHEQILLPAPKAIRFDSGRHSRAKIGYVLLATEQTVQDDVMNLRPSGVGVHIARVPNSDSITIDTLEEQADRLGESAATLLPDGSLDVICYACTSGSLVIGEDRVVGELNRGASRETGDLQQSGNDLELPSSCRRRRLFRRLRTFAIRLLILALSRRK